MHTAYVGASKDHSKGTIIALFAFRWVHICWWEHDEPAYEADRQSHRTCCLQSWDIAHVALINAPAEKESAPVMCIRPK